MNLRKILRRKMDCRVKPGNDELERYHYTLTATSAGTNSL